MRTRWRRRLSSLARLSGVATGTGSAGEAVANKHGELEGDKINKEWTKFSPEAKGKGIPRADIPQVDAEHRGALTQYLKGKGIAHKEELVRPTDLKLT